MRWVRSYLYEALKPSAKLELLPVNENATIRFIPEDGFENGGQSADSMMKLETAIRRNL
jgi:hypothetical protein